MNTDVYAFVALVLQASKALNITILGCEKYNIPTGNITLNDSGSNSPPTLVSYTSEAIVGADDFVDSGVTIKDVFDVIVSITRDTTPTCTFSATRPRSYALIHHQLSWCHLVAWVCTGATIFWRYHLTAFASATLRIIGPFARLSGFLHTPLRSSRSQCSSSGIWFVHPVSPIDLSRNLSFMAPRPTQSPHSLARNRQRTCSATMHSSLNNLVLVTHPSLSPRLVPLASWPITLLTLRSVSLTLVPVIHPC